MQSTKGSAMKASRSLALTAVVLFAASASAAVSVGDKPQLDFKTTDGTHVTSQKLKGKLVLLDFWATWCGPCVREAPHMIQVNNKYGPKGLQIIGVSLDRSAADLEKGVKQLNLTWPQYLDQGNKLSGQFGVNGIPSVFLISPQGEVLWNGHPAQMDAPIEKAFKTNPPQLVDEKALAQARELLSEIEAKAKGGETAAAMKLLARVPEEQVKADSETASRISEVRKSLEADAEKLLGEVDPLIAKGDYVKAINRLKDLSKALAGTPAGATARKKLNELLARPEAREQAEAADKASRSEEALAAAQALQKDRKDDQAYFRFKAVTREFAGTEAAATAAAQVKRYESDKAFVKRVIEKESATRAKAALSMARSYKGARKLDQAKAKYQSIIQDFPGTTYAETARQEMASLGK
jgi:thiol-disulfide isomerase/thioredoxin